ncbi:MAG: hypothetical protein PHC51_04760 [bacterium]|nr:hypothetical protein [bacterium]
MLQQIILDPAVILNLIAMLFTAIYIYHLCRLEDRPSSLSLASKNRIFKSKGFSPLNQLKPDFHRLNQNNQKFGNVLYLTQTKSTIK